MAKIQCYGCQEYGNYKIDCIKPKKDNKKRGREEAHIIKEIEEAKKKKSKKEEVKYLYYDWDSLPHLVLFNFFLSSFSVIIYGYHESIRKMLECIMAS